MTPDRRSGGRDGCDWGWSEINGRRVDYALKVEDVVTDREPVVRRVGRGKSKIVGYRNARVPVVCCPLDWVPHPVYVEMEIALCQNWTAAMRALFEAARRTSFREHALAGVGLDRPPAELPERTRVPQNEMRNKITSATVEHGKPVLTYHDAERVYWRHARAKAS